MRNTYHGLSFVQGSPAPVMASSIVPAAPMGVATAKVSTAVKILTFLAIFVPFFPFHLRLTCSVQLVHLFVLSRGLPTGSSASSIHQGPFGLAGRPVRERGDRGLKKRLLLPARRSGISPDSPGTPTLKSAFIRHRRAGFDLRPGAL